MHMVKHHPEWLHAYIGVGQVVNSSDAERMIYERVLSHAKEQKDDQLVAKLAAITPVLEADSPEREKSIAENCTFVRRELSRLAGESLMHNLFWDDAVNFFSFESLISSHLTLTDISHSVLGDGASYFRAPYTFTQEVLNVDLPAELGNSFDIPIFFFTGAHDWQTPLVLSDKWFGQLTAPYKELIHFEESSHCIVNEEPGKFLMALVNKVLPYAQEPLNRE